MTPEREAEIRAVLNGTQSVDLDYALPVVSRAADDLLDEVERLRAGIKAIRNGCDTLLNPTRGD